MSASTAAFNQTAPANGTAIISLNVGHDSYMGQLNFFYTDSNGGREKFDSTTFDVNPSPQSRAVTWSQAVHTPATSSASAGLQTSISASLVIPNASPATTTTSSKSSSVLFSTATSASPSVQKSSSTKDSALGTGAIVEIVLAIVICAALAAAVIFYRLRRPKAIEAEIRASSPAPVRPHVPAKFVTEKDGSPTRPNELPVDGQLLEMEVQHLEMATDDQ